MSTRRIGILGGSFDPVHLAHVTLAERALDQVELDAVWLVPAAQNPHKEERPRAGAEHRVRMLELAIEDRSSLSICRHELDTEGPHRSVRTVRALRAANPGLRFRFLMGEDSFRDLPRWAEPKTLVQLAPPVVLPRPDGRGPRPRVLWGAPVTWLEGEPMELSSSSIRRAVAAGVEPVGIDPAVLRYIHDEGLYRTERAR